MRGALIVIEGLDRSGKTTQAGLLAERLEGPVKLMRFPDRTTPIGKMIDGYLRSQSDLDDHAIHLLFSANRWELAPAIQRLLNEGTTVICDRYAFSGVAFTFAKQGSIPYDWCRMPDAGLPAPDLTLFLDITPEAAQSRGGYGDERYEKAALQARVRDVFKRIGEDMGGGRWVSIDAGQEREAVTRAILGHVKAVGQRIDGPVGTLWP